MRYLLGNSGSFLTLVAILWVVLTPKLELQAVELLGKNATVVAESDDPESTLAFNPGLTRLSGGRLLATYNLGKGVVMTSDDSGSSWQERANFSFRHARPFSAGDSVYILGHSGDLMIIRSDDLGNSWSRPVNLSEGERWHQAPANVHYANGQVYLVMERIDTPDGFDAWPVRHLAPVLMRASVEDDLTDPDAWTFASELFFRDAVAVDAIEYFGVPFYPFEPLRRKALAPRRNMSPPGWLEANVIRIVDPRHYWYDPDGRTVHLYMRAHTGMTNLAAVVKVVERPDGSMETMLERAPSGKDLVYLPLPGGQMKFHILYDDVSKLYWLLSTQSTDSMTRPEFLDRDDGRFGLADNERHRLQLHFSRNAVDWNFAGMVAIGETQRHARHYASMVIDGDDLRILSRSGNAAAQSAHNTNQITFHTVAEFRDLVY